MSGESISGRLITSYFYRVTGSTAPRVYDSSLIKLQKYEVCRDEEPLVTEFFRGEVSVIFEQSRKRLKVVMLVIAGGALSACIDNNSSSGESEPPSPPPPPLSADLSVSDWSFEGSSLAVSAAQLAGSYAVADSDTAYVEIRDINEQLLHSLDMTDIQAVLDDFSPNQNNALCGMTQTPSGRFLYLAMCDSGGEDAIVAYNTNTKVLSEFERLDLSETEGERFDMTYFMGQLYVGSSRGVYRLDATRNVAYNAISAFEPQLIPLYGSVSGLAVDMVDQMIYASTGNQLFRIPHDSNSPTQVASELTIDTLTMGRVFGNEQTGGGLYALDNSGDYSRLVRVPLAELRAGNQLSFNEYQPLDRQVTDISVTAEGRMMLAGETTSILADITDDRLSYEEWLHDELDQYTTAIKSLVDDGGIAGTSTLVGKPGMITPRLDTASAEYKGAGVTAENAGWALYVLMAIDEVRNDPDIEHIVELILKRHAGLAEDGYGGRRSIDGHFTKTYNKEGDVGSDPKPQVYVSMKLLPAAYVAASQYPDNDIEILTRWSTTRQEFILPHIGIADFWYGPIGLVETIKPGTLDKFREEYFRPELIVKSEAGVDTLHYSTFTPRRVIGHNADGSQLSYGFQMTPFTVPQEANHTRYEILDPEGELLELEDLVNQLHDRPMRFTNPGFEQGLYGWRTEGDVSVVSGLTGSSAKVTGDGSLSQPLDLTMDLDSENANTSDFSVWVETSDVNGDLIVQRRDVASPLPGFKGESVFTMRRRPDDSYYEITFKFKRNAGAPADTAELYMTNFRVDKERLFHEDDCVEDSPTGCLPHGYW